MRKMNNGITDRVIKKKVKYGIIVFIVAVIGVSVFISSMLANKHEYVVSFNTNGGGDIEEIYVKRNDPITEPAAPIKEGYTFVGWYYNDQPYDFSIPVNEDIVLEAIWKGNGKVSSVSLSQNKLELNVDETKKLTVAINPENAANKNVTWKSSNTSVVSVDSQGNIKAIKAGTATITVTTNDGNYSATAAITVIKKQTIKVTGVVLNKTNVSITEGESIKLSATVNPSNATNKNVTWKSSNTSVVSVDSKGNIKAIKPGMVTITVTTNDGNYSATATITVIEKPASYTITFTPIVQDVTNAIMQYSMKITKNTNSFNNYQFVIYNNTKIANNNYLPTTKYNKNITTAMIKLNDGTEVTANVVYTQNNIGGF